MQKEIRYIHVDRYGYRWDVAINQPVLFSDIIFKDGVSFDGGVSYDAFIEHEQDGDMIKIGGAFAKMM